MTHNLICTCVYILIQAAKLKEVVNVTQKLDESVINLEKSLQVQ